MSPTTDHRPLTTFSLRWGFTPDSPLLKAALTHTSAAATVTQSNERLEFLGDALLSAFVARYLVETLPPSTGEDSLSRARIAIIRKETLAATARSLGLSDLLDVGQGERKESRHTHDSLLADAYEAVVAALFLDRGQEAMEAFLRETLADYLAAVVANPPAPDAKTELQMQLQSAGRGLPVYETVSATGTGHDHHFIVEARDQTGAILGRGEGPNKRTAQMAAAHDALIRDSGFGIRGSGLGAGGWTVSSPEPRIPNPESQAHHRSSG